MSEQASQAPQGPTADQLKIALDIAGAPTSSAHEINAAQRWLSSIAGHVQVWACVLELLQAPDQSYNMIFHSMSLLEYKVINDIGQLNLDQVQELNHLLINLVVSLTRRGAPNYVLLRCCICCAKLWVERVAMAVSLGIITGDADETSGQNADQAEQAEQLLRCTMNDVLMGISVEPSQTFEAKDQYSLESRPRTRRFSQLGSHIMVGLDCIRCYAEESVSARKSRTVQGKLAAQLKKVLDSTIVPWLWHGFGRSGLNAESPSQSEEISYDVLRAAQRSTLAIMQTTRLTLDEMYDQKRQIGQFYEVMLASAQVWQDRDCSACLSDTIEHICDFADNLKNQEVLSGLITASMQCREFFTYAERICEDDEEDALTLRKRVVRVWLCLAYFRMRVLRASALASSGHARPEQLAKHFEEFQGLVHCLLMAYDFPNATFLVDEELSDTTVDFWTDFCQEILMVDEVETVNVLKAQFKDLFQLIVHRGVEKLRYPKKAILEAFGNADNVDRFRAFRLSVTEMLLQVSTVLHEGFLCEVCSTVANLGTTDHSLLVQVLTEMDVSVVEAELFCLTEVSESMSTTRERYGQYIHAVYQGTLTLLDYFLNRAQIAISDALVQRLVSSSFAFMGKQSEWLNHDAKMIQFCLTMSMQWLKAVLDTDASVVDAEMLMNILKTTRHIWDQCGQRIQQSHRGSEPSSDNLHGQMLEVATTLFCPSVPSRRSLNVDQRLQIVYTLNAIARWTTFEALNKYITQRSSGIYGLTKSLGVKTKKHLRTNDKEKEDLQADVQRELRVAYETLDGLHTAGVGEGKGRRSRSNSATQQDAQLAAAAATSPMQMHPAVTALQIMQPALQSTLRVFLDDDAIVTSVLKCLDHTCSSAGVLYSGMLSQHVAFIEEVLASDEKVVSPAVMASAGQLAQYFGTQPEQRTLLTPLFLKVGDRSIQQLRNTTDPQSTRPDVVQSFCRFSSRLVKHCPDLVASSPDTVSLLIELCVHCFYAREIVTAKTGVHLMCELMSHAAKTPDLGEFVKGRIPGIVSEILLAISQVGPQQAHTLSDCLYEINVWDTAMLHESLKQATEDPRLRKAFPASLTEVRWRTICERLIRSKVSKTRTRSAVEDLRRAAHGA
eukprot:Clim_evm1s168 gene=Clim_evmTU1s168